MILSMDEKFQIALRALEEISAPYSKILKEVNENPALTNKLREVIFSRMNDGTYLREIAIQALIEIK